SHFNLLTTRRLTLVIVNRRPDNYPDTAGNKESCKLEKPIHFPIKISNSMKKIGELLNIATSYEEKSNK
ncbi:hypothetical protein, partial [Legionella londiniensis]